MINEIPEGWHVLKIGKFSDVISGSTPDTSNRRYWDGDIIWITPDDLSKNSRIYIKESSRRISHLGLKNSSAKIIPKNSIVISSRAPIGYLAIVTSEFTTNQGCKSLHIRDSAISEFVYYSLLFNMNKIKQKGEGTTFAEISKKELEEVSILLPKSLQEQKKIAETLILVNNAVDKTKELIEKHKKIKQGWTRDLFLKGYEETNLSDVAFYQEGPGLREWQWKDKGMKVVNVTNLVDGTLDLSNTYRFISMQEFESHYTHFAINEKDILVASSGNSYCKVSVVEKKHLPLMMNTSVIRFNIKNPKRDAWGYLHQFLMFEGFKAQIDSLITGSAQPNFGPYHLNRVKISRPEYREQETISNFLQGIDLRIKSEQSYLDKLNKIKAGLMQDLLSGKVRVAA
jgi:type I restriction enzyme S subunit